MLIQISYESETLFPVELEKSFKNMSQNIRENKYEMDKMQLDIERFRGDIIRWIANNSEVIK